MKPLCVETMLLRRNPKQMLGPRHFCKASRKSGSASSRRPCSCRNFARLFLDSFRAQRVPLACGLEKRNRNQSSNTSMAHERQNLWVIFAFLLASRAHEAEGLQYSSSSVLQEV